MCRWKCVYRWVAQVYENMFKRLHCFLQKEGKASSFKKQLHNTEYFLFKDFLFIYFEESGLLPSWTGMVMVSSGGGIGVCM